MASPSDQQCLISLGANLGDRLQTLQAAIARLREHAAVRDFRVSSFYETAPIGGPAGQQGFINAAARFTTSLAPLELLRLLQQIESDLGRTRGERWAERTLDLDLLLYGVEIIDTPELVVPHPRMVYRRFVLEPAAEIAGEMTHGPTELRLRQLSARLQQTPAYIAIAGPLGGMARQIAQAVKSKVGQIVLLVSDPLGDDSRTKMDLIAHSRWLWERRRDLEAQLQLASSGAAKVVLSDFWALQWPFDREYQHVSDVVSLFARSLGELVARPTLLVWLKPSGSSMEPPNSGWQAGPPRPYSPTIVIDANDVDGAVTEITAAIAAINDRPRRLPALESEPPPADKS